MAKSFHNDLFDLGLTQISVDTNWQGGTLFLALCAEIPTDISEITSAYPTGKRVSDQIAVPIGDITLGDRSGGAGGRQIQVEAQAGVVIIDLPIIDLGTATSGTSTTLTDTGQSWTTDEHAGKVVKITSGLGAGETGVIDTNTGDTLTITTSWSTTPDATSTYEIRYDLHYVLYDTRFLYMSDESTDQPLTNGNALSFPLFKFGMGDPV